MTSGITALAAMLICTLALAGCENDTSVNQSDIEGNSADIAAGPPADWPATKACAAIPNAQIANTLGQPVVSAALGNVHESDGTTAATSECVYLLADGQSASVMLRWSPIGDNSEGAIKLTRESLKQTIEPFRGEVESVDGLGKAAFWAGVARSLTVFIREDRFVFITVPSGPDGREQAIALGRMLGA